VERARLFCFVCFSSIFGCFSLISGSYGSSIGAPLEHYQGNIGAAWELWRSAIGALSEGYGTTMGTLSELFRSNRGPRSLAPSLPPLAVRAPWLILALSSASKELGAPTVAIQNAWR